MRVVQRVTPNYLSIDLSIYLAWVAEHRREDGGGEGGDHRRQARGERGGHAALSEEVDSQRAQEVEGDLLAHRVRYLR